jgi:single-strand DNA-binding protein
MSVAKLAISGIAVTKPEKTFNQNGKAIAKFVMEYRSERPGGDVDTVRIRVSAWGELAESVATGVGKGDYVFVDGRLQIEKFITDNGAQKRVIEVSANHVETLGKSAASGVSGGSGASAGVPQTAAGGSGASPKKKQADEDLDAIFASEDEIPF